MSTPTTELPVAWQRWVSPDTTRLDGLLARYRERHRRYHTTEHLAWVLSNIDDLSADESIDDLGALIAAAFYHDAVYEPRYPANERASARLAKRDLNQLGWGEDRIDSVIMMIEATRDHINPPDVDSSVLFDADLAILGSGPNDYEAYAKAVRAEYRHVDDDEWMAGRAQVLQSFLDRQAIFATRSGKLRWEEAARMNLEDELESLG